MKRIGFALALVLLPAFPAAAQTPAPISPQPTAAEAPFVEKVSKDLEARFSTTAAARRAGYIRYTDEDETGAISYANRKWQSDLEHPSQLWYDVKGRLLGADFSVLTATSPERPALFGIDPRRWVKFTAHVHYGLRGPNGTTTYGGVGNRTLAKVGGSVAHPSASSLVHAGIAKGLHEVRFVFAFPEIWDLTVWVIPNPNGAFAEKNPNVVPATVTRSTSSL